MTGGPLRAALRDEIGRMERLVAVAGMTGAALCVLIGALMSARWPAEGRAVAIACAGLLLWHGLVYLLVRRGRAVQRIRHVGPFVDITFPTALLLLETQLLGADPTMAASTIPYGYLVILVLQVLRLKPALPIAAGLFGALQYLAVTLLLLRPAMPPAVDATVFAPLLVVVRAALIAVGGVIGGVVSVALRRALWRAHGAVRARELFGKYRLGDEIAAGGMGVVLRATYCPEGGFERAVAVKRIHPHLAREARFVDAFRREAELCARLTHPNIVQVIDFGQIDDTYFFAMEFVDGVTLLELIKRARRGGQRLPSALVAWIGREICAGLEFAHRGARGVDGGPLRVVHRDLSPSNVLLSKTGEVKLLDFGIARVLDERGVAQTGTVVGKLAYMAPEQARGEPLDERCDLYAAGVVLWEALCMKPLFQRASEAATIDAVLHDAAPPPSSLRDDLTASRWDPLLARALQRERERRFQSAAALRAELEELLREEGSPEPGALAALVVAHAPTDDQGHATRTEAMSAAPGATAPTAPTAPAAPSSTLDQAPPTRQERPPR